MLPLQTHYTAAAVGRPKLSRRVGGGKRFTSAIVPDIPDYQTAWVDGSIRGVPPATPVISGKLLKSEPLFMQPLCFTLGATGAYHVSTVPMRHTVRDRHGALATITTGVPPGVTECPPSSIIRTPAVTVYVDKACAEIPKRLDMVCGYCLTNVPLRIGGGCALCIMQGKCR